MSAPHTHSGLHRVIVLDSSSGLLTALSSQLSDVNIIFEQFENEQEVRTFLKQHTASLLLFNLSVDQFDPIPFIDAVVSLAPQVRIVLGISKERRELALDFLRHGVDDVVYTPWSHDELAFQVQKHLFQVVPRVEKDTNEQGFDGIIGQSRQVKAVFDTIKRVAPFDTTLLITGSSGTGKELVAQSLHRNSKRSQQPFVAINCGAIPEHLIESELFGHKKGAFTDALFDKKGLFEEANGGTIFLDEIGELSPQLQVKLLRVLQERTIQPVGSGTVKSVDVRVIAATLTDLERSIQRGDFREDLYYRLHVVHIELPDLCQRKGDIPLLIDFFLAKHGRRLSVPVPQLSAEALTLIKSYTWPGNIRELENCIERALVMHEGGVVQVADLPKKLRVSPEDSYMPNLLDDDNLSIKDHVRKIERHLIVRALEETNGNRTHAAKLLEISHRSLLYKIKEYDLAHVGKT